ncbi:hypothetical protein SCHPADRAFT_833744, partial [Schizopora paradoxa]
MYIDQRLRLGIDDVIDQIRIAGGARFDSLRTEQTRIVSCTEGTRGGVMGTIQDWVIGTESDREHIFWLNGLAGIGKSTIATTIARWARKENMLGGSFFFSRDVAELSSPALVFPTLAFQLAQFDSNYKRALYETLREDKTIASSNLEAQFDALIRRPFTSSRGERPILIVFDALDECSPESDVKEMLQILLHSDLSIPGGPRLRILITSRPEAHIRFVFGSRDGQGHHAKVVLHEIDDKIARKDIETYLKAEFAIMASGERDLPSLAEDWPPLDKFEQLLSDCGKFFAYAATAVRFIGDELIRDPNGQLEEILHTYAELDKLYLFILRRAASALTIQMVVPNENEASVLLRNVMGAILCLQGEVVAQYIAELLFIREKAARSALLSLRSLVIVPGSDLWPSHSSIRFVHWSLRDFLTDNQR